MTTMPRTRGMPRQLVFAYGLPGFVAAIPIIPIAILLPTYYAQELGLGFTVTGIALGLARFIDFLSDVFVGLAVDRFAWQRKASVALRYKPWLFIGGCIAGLALYALSHPGQVDDSIVGGLYLGAWSCVLFLGWTFLMVPYLSWGAVLAHDRHDRSRLTVARETAGLIGMLTALSAPVLVLSAEVSPLVIITWIAIICGTPLLGYCLYRVPESLSHEALSDDNKIRFRDLRELLGFEPFRATLGCWALNSFANGLAAVLFPIVVQQYLKFDERALFVLLFLYFAAGVAAAPLWLKLARKRGKLAAWRFSIVLNVIVFAAVLLIDPESHGLFSPALFYVISALSGLSLAADMALPASIQADVMEHDRKQHHKQRTATAFALWSMATKLALAGAVFIGFVTLGSSGEQFDRNDPSARYLLLGLYVMLPIITKVFVLRLLGKLDRHLSV